MNPVKFEEANKNLLKPASMTDEECGSLWVFTDGKQCISRWKLSWRDRLRVLLYGHVWLSVIGGQTQPPVWLRATRTVFEHPDKVKRIKWTVIKSNVIAKYKGDLELGDK